MEAAKSAATGPTASFREQEAQARPHFGWIVHTSPPSGGEQPQGHPGGTLESLCHTGPRHTAASCSAIRLPGSRRSSMRRSAAVMLGIRHTVCQVWLSRV